MLSRNSVATRVQDRSQRRCVISGRRSQHFDTLQRMAIRSFSYQIERFMPESVSSSILAVSADQLRAFLGKTANLPQISDPSLQLEILSAPEIVTLGQRIEFRITVFGFKQRAIHEYVTVEELQISEDQVEGPLRAWKHSQHIEVISSLECRLTDRIEFVPPGGMLGFLLTEAKVRESIEEGMQIRYDSLSELISSGTLA